ncbi:MAG: MbtH family NRPS accessory protein [Saccharothrix sp.]|nr:MbtH family NRPS accessory protein [Saccharothrix sp.]NUT96356.1 MbtH family NRPS accessory protein [Saccharothrix sp.]
MFEDNDDRHYTVVRNDEEQYSLWPTDRALPPGWVSTGVTGTKSACLDHIRTVWTDMRPKSLREFR